MMITIFTPTYNRAEKLQRLFRSLCEQTKHEFEWLIVDDGSSDDTEQVVEEFKKEGAPFAIRYIKKNNGGKYTAYNEGVVNAKGDLFLCVDSDDYIEKTAVDDLLEIWGKIKEESCIGIIALKKDQNNRLLSDSFPHTIKMCKKIDLEQKYSCRGEFTLVYKTSVLKKYLYPIIPGEKFMGENIIYDQVDQEGQMHLLEQVITVCEYCKDGYTENFLKVVLNNPTGYFIFYKQRIDLAISFKEKMGYIVRYHAFKMMSDRNVDIYKGKNKNLVTLLQPLGYIACIFYMMKKKKLRG